jgi:hypothetical protein
VQVGHGADDQKNQGVSIMSSAKLLGAAAAVAIFAVPALAFGQAQSPMPPADAASPAMSAPAADPAMSAPAADPAQSAPGAGVNTSGTVMDASQMPTDQAKALGQGDNTMVTNGPVPDTPANRAKYGKPMSRAGKRTAPAGN